MLYEVLKLSKDTKLSNFLFDKYKIQKELKLLNFLLKKYKVQPVGNGYIDCIIVDDIYGFVKEITDANIHITLVTWWCYVTEENSKQFGCPHGYGGPKSNYYTGWFSEMCHIPDYTPSDNWDAYDYIVRRVKNEKYYLPCFVPGLFLSSNDLIK